MAGGFHSTGFMDIDMAAYRAQSALVGTQSRSNNGEVGLGTAHQEVNSHVLTAAEGLDFGGSLGTVFILAVTKGLNQVGANQGIQHLLVTAFGIVIVEINHSLSPFLYIFSILSLSCVPVKAHIPFLRRIGFLSSTASEGRACQQT